MRSFCLVSLLVLFVHASDDAGAWLRRWNGLILSDFPGEPPSSTRIANSNNIKRPQHHQRHRFLEGDDGFGYNWDNPNGQGDDETDEFDEAAWGDYQSDPLDPSPEQIRQEENNKSKQKKRGFGSTFGKKNSSNEKNEEIQAPGVVETISTETTFPDSFGSASGSYQSDPSVAAAGGGNISGQGYDDDGGNGYGSGSGSNSGSGGSSSGGGSGFDGSGGGSYGSYSGTSSGGSSSDYGGSSYGGSSSSGSYGGSSSSGNSYSGYGGSSNDYSDYGGYGEGGSSNGYHSGNDPFQKVLATLNFKVPLLPMLIAMCTVIYLAMVCVAFQFQNYPEGTFANLCRLTLHTWTCMYKVAYNLYHCRLGELPTIVCAMDDEDDYDEEDLERMTVRPGLGRAMKREHDKLASKLRTVSIH